MTLIHVNLALGILHRRRSVRPTVADLTRASGLARQIGLSRGSSPTRSPMEWAIGGGAQRRALNPELSFRALSGAGGQTYLPPWPLGLRSAPQQNPLRHLKEMYKR